MLPVSNLNYLFNSSVLLSLRIQLVYMSNLPLVHHEPEPEADRQLDNAILDDTSSQRETGRLIAVDI